MTAALKTEEKTAHTPGPWEQQDYAVCVAFDSDHCIMYKPNRTPRAVKASEYIANARLIAAAPCMLEALRNLVMDWERVIGPIPEDHEAQVAIAKAEGGAA